MLEDNKSNFNQALWLGISSLGSFVVVFLTSAILSRYFPKSEYGTYKQIMFVYTMLQTVFSAGLQGVFSYFIPRLNMEEGKTLVNRVTLLLAVFGGLCSAFMFLSSDYIALILKNEELAVGLKLFSLVPFFTLPSMGIEGIYTALRKTRSIVFYQFIGKLLILLSAVCPVIILGGTYKMSIIGWTISSFIMFLFSLWMKDIPYRKVKRQSIPNIYTRIFRYSFPLLGATIVGVCFQSANQFFISRYYGQVVFAEFSNGFISLPFVAMVTGSIKSVLWPLFSKADSKNNINDLRGVYSNAVIKAVNLVYPIVLFSIIFAKDIMCFIYGDKYIESSSYFQISLFRDLFEVLPFLAILLAVGKSNIYFYVNLILTILLWGIDFILIYFNLLPFWFCINSAFIQILILISFLVYIQKVIHIRLISVKILKHMCVVIIHLMSVLFVVNCCIDPLLDSFVLPIRLLINIIIFYIIISLTGRFVNINYLEAIKMIKK